MSATTTLFKVTAEDGACYHGGHGQWHLPTSDSPGKWMPKLRGALEPCRRGYHLCRESDLVNWLGPVIWIAEYDGDRVDVNDVDEGKVVVRRARLVSRVPHWNAQSARLFACDCAERALNRERERGGEPDPRSWESITVARRFARGEATQEELAAAWDAAWTAAWDAARAAAWTAAWAAARDAAWATERQWQTERLHWYLAGQPAEVPS